jgi:predicted porin
MKRFVAGAMLAAGVAQGAAAQSAVTIYGIADAGLVQERGGPAGSLSKLTGGVASASRLGFRGTEDLGDGTAAVFNLEMGINLDQGTLNAGGGIFGRQAFLGLKGNYGTVTAGRQYTQLFLAINEVMDPFKTGTAGRANNIFSAAGTRVNNSVRYTSAALNGVSVDLLYGLGEVADRAAAGRHLAGALQYSHGALAARLVYDRTNDLPGPAVPINTATTKLLTASYQLSAVKLHAGYAVYRDDKALDARDALLGLTFVTGRNRLSASYVHHDDRASFNGDVNQAAVGWFYALSKRSDVYLAYAKMDRKNRAAPVLFFVGNASDTGSGDTGFNLGLRHLF